MHNFVTTRLRALLLLALFSGLVASILLQARNARAFDLGDTTIVMELELPNSSGEFAPTTDQEKIKDYFGLANCVCGETEFGVKFSLDQAPASFASSAKVDVWLGSSCDAAPENIQVRDMNCENPKTFDDIEELITPRHDQFPVHWLLAPKSEICEYDSGTRSVFAIIDEGTDGVDGEDISAVLELPFDMDPPPMPTSVKGEAAEEAIQLSWDLPTSSEEIRYFQVLCARADGSEEESDGFGKIDPQYLTSQMVCKTDADDVHPVDVEGTVSADLPASLYDLKDSTICAEAAGNPVGIRIAGLENEVAYRIVLLTVDDYRNVTALDLGEHTPKPVEDAWEHYKKAGGNADGGYCFVATATYGNYDHAFVRILRNFRDDTLAHSEVGRSFIAWYYANSPELAAFIARHQTARTLSYLLLAPLVSFAAVWEYTFWAEKLLLLLALGLSLSLWRRRRSNPEPTSPSRRRRVLLASAGALLLLSFSTTASAQPYWDELNQPLVQEDTTPEWEVSVKFGPYYPDVDAEFTGTGAFEEVFGTDPNLMSIISLDRYFRYPLGQLGVTGSIGFSKQYANAFAVDGSGNALMQDGEYLRSASDKTKFRLLPISVGVVYRFTKLDDDYNIPIIPYGRASLAYYVWWFTDPADELSEAATPSCPNAGAPGADCEGDIARGGSLGYQASLGIALRAERIDPSAEVSLRTEMGIEHAGFFAEIQMAKVDGFGADKKLSVGDTTWFGGINFEF